MGGSDKKTGSKNWLNRNRATPPFYSTKYAIATIVLLLLRAYFPPSATPPPPSSEVTSQLAASGQNPKAMSVIFDILNNPVPRGSDQNVTITVSDAASNERIAGATITGVLLYPGGNYVKEFAGSTSSNGQFMYSWTIGENGDTGELTIEAQVAAPGYESQSATGAFQVTEG